MSEQMLNYNNVLQFMKDFKIDYLNRYGELIIDEKHNIYAIINNCTTMDEVKTYVVFALCRPIGKQLERKEAERLLKKLNDYFGTHLTRSDLLAMYSELCYVDKVKEFQQFIKDGFPVERLKLREG